MSELINKSDNRAAIRWKLLTGVSAVAILGWAGGAFADDAKPVLWIEAGGQFEQLSDSQEPYAPPFVAQILDNPFTPPAEVQAPPRFSIGEEARISFTPEDSSWTFSAAIRYGRATRKGNSHEETSPGSAQIILSIPIFNQHGSAVVPPLGRRYATSSSLTHDSDIILDFQAGKDVGIGVFGGHSTVGAGVRFAQFKSHANVRLDADPNFAITYKYQTTFYGFPAYIKIPNQSWDLYLGRVKASRSFSGFGPSLEWDGSATLAGQTDTGAIAFDWGVNGAVLFGHQKVRAHHQTTDRYAYHLASHGPLPIRYQTTHDVARSHSVTVPNIGGFAGLSLRYPNAKISIGYRADFFFNAIDGGIDARKSENRGFYGPFASISIGVGGSSN